MLSNHRHRNITDISHSIPKQSKIIEDFSLNGHHSTSEQPPVHLMHLVLGKLGVGAHRYRAIKASCDNVLRKTRLCRYTKSILPTRRLRLTTPFNIIIMLLIIQLVISV